MSKRQVARLKFCLSVVLFLLSQAVQAAQVEKISKEGDQLLISPELGERFQVGDKVCVEGRSWKKVCGKVTRKKGSKAVAKMEEAVEGTRRGDPVSLEERRRSWRYRDESDWEEGGWKEGRGREDWNRRYDRWDDQENRYGRYSGWGRRNRDVSLLLKGGLVSSSTYPNTGVGDDNFKIKGTIGLGFNVPLDSDTWSFESALHYHAKGVEIESGDAGSSLGYLEAPLLFKVRFLNDTWSPVVLLGPYVAYLMSATIYQEGLEDQDIRENLKDFDIGLMSGFGFDFDTSSSSRLGIHFYSSWGFVDLAAEGDTDARNKQVGLLMNLYFDL